MDMIDVRVSDIYNESPTIKSFRLVRADGTPIGNYTPGAHIDVEGPTSLTRQYSLCGTPEAEDSFVFAVKRAEDSRGGSAALHDLEVGDTLRISAPRNLVSIAQGADHHVLVAAGIGITPMLSLARYMDVHDISFDLYYFARSREQAAFLPVLEEKCPEKLHAYLGMKRDEQSVHIAEVMGNLSPGAHVYVCGPQGFIDKVVGEAEKHLPSEAVHVENFHPTAEVDEANNSAFDVELEDEVYHVPAERSIASVLQENDCDIDTSCEEGICGTCIMEVVEGEPEHRDNVLSKSERESDEVMTVCVSRTRNDKLVLDYY